MRFFRTACKVNLLLAILVAGAYLAYGLSNGLPIEKHFLGLRPIPGSYGQAPIPAWIFPSFMVTLIVGGFVIGRFRNWDRLGYALFCGFVGAWMLAMAFWR